MNSRITKTEMENLLNTVIEMLDKKYPNKNNIDMAIKLIEDTINDFS